MHHKITPPVASRHAVERAELLAMVQAASQDTRVLLVSAPAGFGKTTMLAQLYRRWVADGLDCAWLRLDEADNDLPRFVASMGRALETSGGDQDRRQRGGEPPPGRHDPSEGLLEAIGRRALPFALFIDDLEMVSSPAVLALIAGLVNRLPPQTMVVLASRGLPDIGLARLRARGQLIEIGARWLRLSAAETDEFLRLRRGVALGDDQLVQLHMRTEGWVTALWLASLALEQHSDPAQCIAGFTGASMNLADYFADVVLAAQPDPVRDFLLKTCIFDQLVPAACDAVRGSADSALMLAHLEEAHLFVSASDEDRSAYRYHSLFSDFLRETLKRTQPGWIPMLHRAASDWFLTQGRPVPAISHALHAGIDVHSLNLLQAHADSLLRQGRARLLTRWLDPLPDAALTDYPQLRLAHAWAVAFTRGAHEALGLGERQAVAPERYRQGEADLPTLRPLLWFMTDQIDEAHALALQNLPLIESQKGFGAAMSAQTLANTHLARGQYSEARHFADLARHLDNTGSSPFHLALAESVEGAIDLIQGRLHSAVVCLRAASDANRGGVGTKDGKLSGLPFPETLLAEALYETGDIVQAEPLLRRVVPLLLDIALPDQLITAHVLLARLQRGRGEIEAALHDLERLETTGHRLRLPRAVACARLERAWGLIEQGDFAEAQRQIDRSGSVDFWRRLETRCHVANDVATQSIAQARLLIRRGSSGQTVSELKQLLAQAEGGERSRRALKLRILLAEALHGDGQTRLAMRQLSQALSLAAREGWVQTFLEEGPGVRALLLQYAEQQKPGLLDEAAVLDAAHLRRLTGSATDTWVPSLAVSDPTMALTTKEHKVLQLLAGGRSNQAIADQLFVSTSTVRAHLRSINVKLEASSRTQAVAIARQRGLID